MYRTRSHCTNKTRAASTTWLWKRLLARSLHPSSIVYSSMIDVWTCELPRMGYCFKVSQSSSPVADPRHLKISRIYIKFFKNPEALLRPLSAARVLIIVAWGTMADVELYYKLMNDKLHFQMLFFTSFEVLLTYNLIPTLHDYNKITV